LGFVSDRTIDFDPTQRRSHASDVTHRVGDEGIAVTVRRGMRIVSTWRWLILGTTLGVAALTVLVTLFQTPEYTATVRLQIDREASKVVEGADTIPIESAGGGQEFLRTQFELLRSRSLAERVVGNLQLASQPDFLAVGGKLSGALRRVFAPAGDRDGDPMEARRLAADRLQDVVIVRPILGSRLIDVSYSDPLPARAQRVANGYAEAFVSANLDKRFDANAYAKTFLEDQVKQVSQRLEEAERAVVAYAEREQMIDTTDNSATLAEQNLSLAQTAFAALSRKKSKLSSFGGRSKRLTA
jgi:uncharacterized protein involved in exopolysaccharide biosynthesis